MKKAMALALLVSFMAVSRVWAYGEEVGAIPTPEASQTIGRTYLVQPMIIGEGFTLSDDKLAYMARTSFLDQAVNGRRVKFTQDGEECTDLLKLNAWYSWSATAARAGIRYQGFRMEPFKGVNIQIPGGEVGGAQAEQTLSLRMSGEVASRKTGGYRYTFGPLYVKVSRQRLGELHVSVWGSGFFGPINRLEFNGERRSASQQEEFIWEALDGAAKALVLCLEDGRMARPDPQTYADQVFQGAKHVNFVRFQEGTTGCLVAGDIGCLRRGQLLTFVFHNTDPTVTRTESQPGEVTMVGETVAKVRFVSTIHDATCLSGDKKSYPTVYIPQGWTITPGEPVLVD